MADYKGLNIRFRGDTTDASKALHILSSEAKAAQGNLNAIQESLKNTATNGKNLDEALKSVQLQQMGNAAQAASGKVNAYEQSLVGLNKRLYDAQLKLVTNRDTLESMPAKYDALASSASQAFERVAQAQQVLDEAKEKVAFAGSQESWVQAINEQVEAQMNFNAAVEAGDEEFRKVSATYGTFEGAINSAEESIRATGAEIENTTQKMLVQESQAKALAAEQTRLAASMTDMGQWGAGAQEFGNTLQGVGSAISSVGDKLTIVSGIAAITFGRNIVSSTEEFGNAIAQLGGYLDIQGESLDQMSDQALKWGKDTQFSATEAANAMNELAKGGMTQAQISGGAMKATMELAAAGQLDMAQAAETSVQAIKTFGLSAEDASRVADALAGAANESTAEVSDLANGFKYVGGWASMAGWNINDVSGALALLSDHGLQSEMAGTALRNVMQRLAAPTDTAAKLMNAYGFSVRDSEGHMVSAVEVVKRLNDTFGNLADEEKQNVLNDIFGARALPAAIALMNEGADSLQGYIDSTSQAGYATEMAKNRMGDLGWALEYLRGEAETAAVNFGQALAPSIIGLAKNIEGLLEWFNSLDDSTKQFIAQSAVMAVAVGPVISGIGHLSKGAAGLVGSFGTAITTISEFVALSADGGSKVKRFAEALALAKTPAAETAEGIAKVAENAAVMEKTLQTAGTALKGAIAVAAVAWLADQIKSVVDEVQLVSEATKSMSDIAREAGESVASMGDEAEKAGSKASTIGQAVAGMNASLKESAEYNKDVASSLKEMEGNVSSAERYAATIKELSSVGSLSAAQQEQLKQAVDGYNEVTGAAIRITDDMRGTLNLLPQDIDKVTEAYVRQEKVKVYTELQSEALKEQIRAQKDAKKAAEETQNTFWNWQNILTTAANSFTGLGQIMNIVNYGKAAIGLKGVSDASEKATYDVNYFKEAAEAAGMSTEQYTEYLKQLFPELNKTGDGAEEAAEKEREAAEQAAQAATDAANAIKKANDAIVRERQREYDHAYKALQKTLDAEYKARQKAYDKEYKGLQKALDKEYKLRQKELDKAYKERQKQIDKEYDAYKDSLDAEVTALKKSLDSKQKEYKKSLDSELSAYKKSNDAILKQQKKAYDAQTKAFKAETDKRVKALQDERDERIKALEANDGTKEIDSRIKSLKDQTKAEQAEIKRRGEEEKKAELEMAVERAKTRRARADAEKALNDYLAELAQEHRENEREAEIERLEDQKDIIKERTDTQKDAIKEEYAARIDALKESRSNELDAIKEANDLEYETMKEKLDGEYQLRKEHNELLVEQRKEANELEIEDLKEQNELLLEARKEQDELKLESIKEQQEAELELIKEDHELRLEELKEFQTSQLEAMKESQEEILQALKDSQQDQLDAMRQNGEDMVASANDTTGELKKDSDQKLADADAWKNQTKETYKQAALGMGENLTRTLFGFNPTLSNIAGQLYHSAVTEPNKLPSTFQNIASSSTHNLENTFNIRRSAIGGAAGAIASSVDGNLSSIPSSASANGSEAMYNLQSNISHGGTGVANAASRVVGNINSQFDGLGNNSYSWGSDMMFNLNEGIVSYWNNVLLPNLVNIANNIANLLAHSKPKEGPLKDDDQWFYHMGQNLNKGLMRSVPEIMGTVNDLADGIADGMNVDVVSDFIDNMRSNEYELAKQSRRMAEIVSDEFNPYATGNYSLGYDVKPMAQLLTNGVTEALRSGVPQRQGVTVVVQNMQVREESDIQRVSERLYALGEQTRRRGW